MNEITKIHLGRQSFTISVDAHKALQEYLRAITRHAENEDVVDEVEIRMAELLTERGVQGDKVVLLKDVEYLKEQLGQPGDFGEEEADRKSEAAEEPATKRLFRDTENGMVAGVCAGLAKFFGVDPLIVRLIFIALTFAGASGALIYFVLWVLVPEAKTTSDRLQMQGKPVTVDALKDVVERADVKGAAKRAQNTVGKAVNTVLKVILAIIGLAVAITGAATLLAVVATTTYILARGSLVNNQVVFPLGSQEVLLVICGMLVLAIIGLFLMLGGIAMVKRKWSLPGWATGSLLALFLLSGGVGTALTAAAVPAVSERVDKAQLIFRKNCHETAFSYCFDPNKKDDGQQFMPRSPELRIVEPEKPIID